MERQQDGSRLQLGGRHAVAARQTTPARSQTGTSRSSEWVHGGSLAEWLACWTQAQKGPGSNRSRDAVGQQS